MSNFISLLRNAVAEFPEHSLKNLPCSQLNKLHPYFEQLKNNRANPAMSDALMRPVQVAGAERVKQLLKAWWPMLV